jgi:sugar phosphate isomerase/epimerase
MPRPGPLSLNLATVRERWGLPECVEGCARHGIPGIAPWRDALADAGGAERAARRIRAAGLRVSSLCRTGLFTAADRAGRRAAIADARRAIGEAHALGAACLVVVSGGLPPGSKDLAGAREMVRDGLAEILGEARAAGVTLALEPQHPLACADRAVLCTLAQALDLCAEMGAGVGVVVDTYHVWWDPDLARQLARAQGRIALFQASDWLAPTTDLAPDRGMPGEGVIDIPRLRALAEAAGYKGPVEVEVLSRRWWAREPEEVLRAVKACHASAC